MADDIQAWLDRMGLGEYADAFTENGVGIELLPHITNDDLKDLGIVKLADRKKVLLSIEHLRSSVPDQSDQPTTASGSTVDAVLAERRQVTVMFVDLVGSTALSARLDPEEMGDVIRAFQDVCAGVITRFGGHVAKYLGDGVLAYFGWPLAHEDEAERACRSAIDLVTAVTAISPKPDIDLAVRVGIATGLVVVGELIGEGASREQAIVGTPPNLAARLQTLAKPGTVVIDAGTRRLMGTAFEFRDLGQQEIKGLPQPIALYELIGRRKVESRFMARAVRQAQNMVGRDHEFALLADRWRKAENADGQAVLLSGEAGIGKSRLAQQLIEHAQSRNGLILRFQCSALRTDSALFPVIRQLELAAGFADDDPDNVRLDKLEALLSVAGDDISERAPYFAHLLSLPVELRYGAIELAPQHFRQKLMVAFAEQLVSLARNRPVLMLFEDVHWIDPTSQSLLELTVGALKDIRLLLVATHRPEWDASVIGGYDKVTSLHLSRLDHESGGHIAKSILGEAAPEGVLEQIVSRADGIPLYIEELANSVAETGSYTESSIPETLQASLSARLDHLPSEAKFMAQVGALLGREFRHDVLSSVIRLSKVSLGEGAQALSYAGLVYRTGGTGGVRYRFKHALVQESAYSSLLLRDRMSLHGKAGDILEREFPDLVAREPEMAARHFNEAGDTAKALRYWRLAGDDAFRRSAALEAERLYTRCLGLLTEIDPGGQTDDDELKIQLALGNVLIATRGLHSKEVAKAFDRARFLAERLNRPVERFEALFGLWVHTVNLPDLAGARELATQLQSAADDTGNPELVLQAHHSSWTNEWAAGNFRGAIDHVAKVEKIYDVKAHRQHKFRFGGHDPAVCGFQMKGLSLCFLGFPDQAIRCFETAEHLATEIQHPFSWVLLQWFHSIVRQMRGEVDLVHELCAKAYEVAIEKDVSLRSSVATILGWAEFQKGERTTGLARIREGLDASKSIGTEIFRPYSLGLLARCQMASGEIDAAERALNEGLNIIERIGREHWSLTALMPLQADLAVMRADDHVVLDELFGSCLRATRRVHALYDEISVATQYARLLCSRGERERARNLVEGTYSKFSEGFDTARLKEARALIAQAS